MRAWLLWASAAAWLGACGGTAPRGTPAPDPGPPPAPAPATPDRPLRYRLPGPLVYEIERYDTLFYASMPGAPEAAGKRGILTVRPLPGRTGEVEVRLDSLGALEETRLTRTALDSTIGTRWRLTLGPDGPKGGLLGGQPTILAGQAEALVRLLFPQLPPNGLRVRVVWTDSTAYRVRLDAFNAMESAARSSQAEPAGVGIGVTVEANERLGRTGTAVQGGQPMTLSGTGLRRIRYVFAPDGWVRSFSARDSLDLRVTVGAGGAPVLVRWRATLTGRQRDLPLR